MNTEQIIQEIEEHLNKGDIKSATKALYNHYEGFSDFDMCKEISGILYKQYKHWRSELIALLLEKIIRMNPNIAQVNFPNNFLFKLCITTGSMDMYECFIEEAVEPFLKDESEDVKWDYYAELSNIAHSLNDYFFPNYDRYEYGVDYKGAFAVYEKNSDFFLIEKDDYYAMEEVVETFNKIVGRRDVVAELDEKLNEDLNEDNNRNFGNKLRMYDNKEYISITTHYKEYDKGVPEHLTDMYQIHIFSPTFIDSYYYNPEKVSEKEVNEIALKKFNKIKKKTDKDLNIGIFSHNGVYLISDDQEEFLQDVHYYEYNLNDNKFEYVSSSIYSIYDFIGEYPFDEYIRKAFKSVGADRFTPHIEPLLKTKKKQQNAIHDDYNRVRAVNKQSPRILVEIFKIEKNYIPVKVKEFYISHMSSLYVLPEHREVTSGERTAFKTIDIESGKVIENHIHDTIEGIKYAKWERKHPLLIDLNDAMRMELDNDDPNFLSWDDFVANDDEYEEGDDEYEPRF